jgi:hypothetical protein
MPTIVCTQDNKTAGMVEGFDELGGTDKFTTDTLARLLASKGVLKYSEAEKPKLSKPLNNVVSSNRSGKAIYGHVKNYYSDDEVEDDFWTKSDSDSDSDDDEADSGAATAN